MQVFDPRKRRELLGGSFGYELSLAFPFERAVREGSLGYVSNSHLGQAIQCILVGYDEPAQRLLHRAREWLTMAIESNEHRDGHSPVRMESQRRMNLALCNWLLYDQNNAENYRLFVENDLRYLSESGQGRNKLEISLGSPEFVDAGAFHETLELLARVGISAPANPISLRTEGQMCYVLCRHYLGQQYSAGEVSLTLERFFRRAINHWLLDGHFTRAARWMKIAYWNPRPGTISAKDAVLKCYDFLKNPIPVGPDQQP